MNAQSEVLLAMEQTLCVISALTHLTRAASYALYVCACVWLCVSVCVCVFYLNFNSFFNHFKQCSILGINIIQAFT